MLESQAHGDNCFITLTYAPDTLPSDGSLNKKHLQDWLKRFRKAIEPLKVRYYACGEYGEQTFRPHYHAILFGVGVQFQSLIQQTWKLGFIQVGDVTVQSAAYVSGYVTKKLRSSDLKGRAPEFSMMSLKPGLGVNAMQTVGDALMTKHGSALVAQLGDVPLDLQHGSKKYPLGRFLRSKLREITGFESVGAQTLPETIRKEELLALRKDYGTDQTYAAAKPFVEWKKSDRKVFKHKLYTKKGTI